MLTKQTISTIRHLYSTYIESTDAFDIRLANEGWSKDLLVEAQELTNHAIRTGYKTEHDLITCADDVFRLRINLAN